MSNKKCEICEKLKNNETYKVEGSWIDLEIKKLYGKIKIQAYGDGVAEMDMNYYPECGRKLVKDE